MNLLNNMQVKILKNLKNKRTSGDKKMVSMVSSEPKVK